MKRAFASGKHVCTRPNITVVEKTRTYKREYPMYVEIPYPARQNVIRMQDKQKSQKNYRKPVAKRTKVRYNIIVKFKSFTDKIHKKRQERMTKMANKKFLEAQIRAEVLSSLYDVVQEKIKDTQTDYRVVKKNATQATDWKTGEYLWEDEEQTIPKMKDEWGHVTKTDDELTEEDRIRIDVLRDVGKALEKLL